MLKKKSQMLGGLLAVSDRVLLVKMKGNHSISLTHQSMPRQKVTATKRSMNSMIARFHYETSGACLIY